jgi:transposase-like protein
MPWSHTSPMDQKIQFIADDLRATLSITELCQLYHISRKTAEKWLDRYREYSPAGLEEHSRKPGTCPRQTPDAVVAAIIDARRHHPAWGRRNGWRSLPNAVANGPGLHAPPSAISSAETGWSPGDADVGSAVILANRPPA